MAHFVKKKKKVTRTNKNLWSALFASYVHNLAEEIKGMENVRYQILKNYYNPKYTAIW